VGRLAAADLGAPFVDLDSAVERRAGKSIARIFSEEGETAFRAMERSEMDVVLGGAPGVIATGGGWAAQPGNLESVVGRALTVYLRVAPEVAAQRVAPTADHRQPIADSRPPIADSRPLLAGGDVAARVHDLFSARRAFYERCEATVAGDRADPNLLAGEVVRLARSLGGWY
jgi:shikimate kinase